MRVGLEHISKIGRGDECQNSANKLFNNFLLGSSGEERADFLVNPHFCDLPSCAEVMNIIDGLPIAIEGADTVFQGGLRFPNKSIVAAVSGTFGVGGGVLLFVPCGSTLRLWGVALSSCRAKRALRT